MSHITNEILKLRTIRSSLLLLAAAQLVVVAGVSGIFVSGRADLSSPLTPLRAVAHAGLVSIFSLILGIVAVAGEYRHRTVTDTFLGTPRRGKVIAAKLAVFAAAGTVLGLTSVATALVTTSLWLSAKDQPFDISSMDLWLTLGGCVVWNAGFAAIGVGVGAAIRSLSGAIAASLAWLAVVEGIVGQLIGDLGRWLPFASGVALERLPAPGVSVLPQWGGAAMLAAYTAIFVGIAVSTTVRRDVA